MQDRQLTNYVIAKRMRDKARAPYWTAAKNALQRGERKLHGKHRGNISYLMAGAPIGRTEALEMLQKGVDITLQMYVCTRQRNQDDFLDEGDWRLAAETVVKIKVASH